MWIVKWSSSGQVCGSNHGKEELLQDGIWVQDFGLLEFAEALLSSNSGPSEAKKDSPTLRKPECGEEDMIVDGLHVRKPSSLSSWGPPTGPRPFFAP